MNKEKIGFTTLYYNSENYGGIAQTYGLYKYLSNLGYDVKVINYKPYKKKTPLKVRLIKRVNFKNGISGFFKGLLWVVRWVFNEAIVRKINRKKYLMYNDSLKTRKERFAIIRESIPHTAVVDRDTISLIKDDFDVFISGSDQIWKPSVVQDAYVLKFAEGKTKFSYSSSITTTNICDDEVYSAYMKQALSDFKAVSVREEASRDELQKIIGRPVEWVVDPTILLPRENWEELCSEPIVKEKYIFAYFLGKGSKQKEIVERIAKENNLVIVNLPFVAGEYNKADETFGDIKLFDVGLGEFFSLIKNAECVFTDSFHAVCFSWIFKTRFYVFDRDVGFDGTKMSSRIDSILKLMNLEDRKIDCDSNVDLEQNVNFVSEDLCDMITKSRKYLDDALRD